MAVNSVASSTGAALQVQQPRQDQPNPASRDTQRAQDSEQARQARQAQRPRESEKQPEPQAPEAPKPVVNTQGQTTGQLINVKA